MDMRSDKTLGEMGAPPHMEKVQTDRVYCHACSHAVWGHSKSGCFHAEGLGVNRHKCGCKAARRPEQYNPDTHMAVSKEEWEQLKALVMELKELVEAAR